MTLGSAVYRITSVSKSWITPERRLAIYLRDKFTCVACGLELEDQPAYMVTLDHVVSRCTYSQWPEATRLEFGSINKTSNLVTCCNICNASKNKSDKYKTPGALSRVRRAIRKPINMKLARSLIKGN